ncbi:MAG: Nif3-like dinuclear metal center hexameric protein [Coriobacteriales bacterium]
MTELTVGQLEEALFRAFPASDAEGWDHPGLAAGDRSALVRGVAVNLDMTPAAVIAAAEAGCNVLLTHHPAFIKGGPSCFAPQGDAAASGPGRLVWEAASRGVALIAMHTNADRSLQAREAFTQLLGWSCEGCFEQYMDPKRSAQGTGFGAVFVLAQGSTLAQAAQRALEAFGGSPRVWGDPQRTVRRLAFLNGSWGEQEVYDICVAQGIDCAMVGETRYHFCADAQPHLAVIDLGHDVSELPLQRVLAQALAGAGVAEQSIHMLQCSAGNWWTPQTLER